MSQKSRIIAAFAFAVISGTIGGQFPAIRYWAALCAVLAACCAILLALADLSRRLWTVQGSFGEYSKITTINLAAELHSMEVVLRRCPECVIPTSSWSMRFANLHAILDMLDRVRPQTIVELGSGISTVCVASWLKSQGKGTILSFDHDNAWGELTMRCLRESGLDAFAKIVIAPLKPDRSLGYDVEWYDVDPHIAEISDVDVVIVDGPPAYSFEKRISRLPALDKLHKRLSPAAVIVLDDALRSGEGSVVDIWLKSFPEFALHHVGSLTGLAILERSATPQPTRQALS